MTAAPPIANRYEVLETLGEGAMGLVWRVHDSVANQEVALKIISQRYGASAPGEAPSAKSVLQFQQEFRLMTQLRHPNCCAVYEYGLVGDGSPFFTMEVVEGRGLDELKPLDGPTFVHVLSQVLLALGYIHQLGFVHCDLKSANVRVKPDGTVKLMDYGLMEYARRPSGFINGTIAYISPEVIRRGAIDQRTDLYSLGVLAYEMLTGQVPFNSNDARLVLGAHINEAPVPPSPVNRTWHSVIDDSGMSSWASSATRLQAARHSGGVQYWPPAMLQNGASTHVCNTAMRVGSGASIV